MTRLVSAIYSRGPAVIPDAEAQADRTHAARAALWHKLGLIVVDPAHLANEWLERALIEHAETEYGPRRGRSERA